VLTRTTRSVSPTAAGERVLRTVGQRFDEIEGELEALSEFRDKPSGTIRITATEYATTSILLQKLATLLPQYPDISVEITVDYGLTDIVAHRYDAGVRWAEQVAKDMVAVRIAPDMRMAVVAAPSYFASRSRPKSPQELTAHNCINLRLPTPDRLSSSGTRQPSQVACLELRSFQARMANASANFEAADRDKRKPVENRALTESR
jgi:DNA-binding transcriptional LysR family regulator